MANARIGALRVDLGMNTAAFEKGITLAQRKMSGLSKSMKRIGRNMRQVGTNLTIGITAPLAAFGVQAAKAAIDAEEMNSAFDVVFKESAESVREWARVTGDAMGRSTEEIQAGALAFQELFGKALDQDSAVEASKNFAVLAQDLASFKNLSNEVAQQKLFSGLTGEAEPLRAVGVFINDAAVQTKALELGLQKVNGKYTDQQKIVARAALIQEQLSDAQGDVLRTADSAANQIRASQAAFQELSVVIGQKIVPLLTPFVQKITELLNRFTGLDDRTQKIVLVIAGIAAAIGPVLIALGAMTTGVGVLAGAFGALSVAALPITATIAAFAAVGVIVYKNWDKVKPMLDRLKIAFANLFGAIDKAFGGNGKSSEALAKFGEIAQWVLEKVVIGALTLTIGRIETFVNFASRAINTAINIFDMLATNVRAKLKGLRETFDWLGEQTKRVGGFFYDLYDKVVGNSYVPDMVDGIQAQFDRLDRVMVQPTKKATTAAKKAFRELAEDVRGILAEAFPKIEARRERYAKEDRLDQAVEKGLIGQGVADAAKKALGEQDFEGGSRRFQISAFATGPQGPLAEAGRVNKAADEVAKRMAGLAKGTKTQTVKIAKSFAEMAKEAVDSLRGMINAIKGGNFLDILSSVFGIFDKFGILGGTGKAGGLLGAFAGLFADGGRFPANKFGIVGENGPELFMPGRAGYVVPNSALGKMGGGMGGSNINVSVDARGATDPAQVEAAARRAVLESAPAIVAASQSRTIQSLSRPRLAGIR